MRSRRTSRIHSRCHPTRVIPKQHRVVLGLGLWLVLVPGELQAPARRARRRRSPHRVSTSNGFSASVHPTGDKSLKTGLGEWPRFPHRSSRSPLRQSSSHLNGWCHRDPGTEPVLIHAHPLRSSPVIPRVITTATRVHRETTWTFSAAASQAGSPVLRRRPAPPAGGQSRINPHHPLDQTLTSSASSSAFPRAPEQEASAHQPQTSWVGTAEAASAVPDSPGDHHGAGRRSSVCPRRG